MSTLAASLYESDFYGWLQDQARDILDENPSLKPLIPEYMEKAWETAKRKAARGANIAQSTFPTQCPWSFDQIMDDDFWPD